MRRRLDLLRTVVLPTLRAKLGLRRSADADDQSLARWKLTQPHDGLTLGERMSGSTFIEKVLHHSRFGDSTRVLEVGPGYGRLLQAMLENGTRFRSYVGVDISPSNVEYLTRTDGSDRFRFVEGDIESLALTDRFDVAYLSPTFQHFYPTF